MSDFDVGLARGKGEANQTDAIDGDNLVTDVQLATSGSCSGRS